MLGGLCVDAVELLCADFLPSAGVDELVVAVEGSRVYPEEEEVRRVGCVDLEDESGEGFLRVGVDGGLLACPAVNGRILLDVDGGGQVQANCVRQRLDSDFALCASQEDRNQLP